MALKDIVKGLADAVTDLSQQTTVTYTGDLSAQITDANFNPDHFKDAINAGRTGGTVHLSLFTQLDADGDATNFFQKNSDGDGAGAGAAGFTGLPQEIIDAHGAAVDLGMNMRMGYLKMFKDIAGL